jgi:hypothetical protein
VKIPEGKTEEEVVAIIDKVVSMLAGNFVFGYHDSEDIKQFGRMKAVEILNKGTYDSSKPLENYLYVHIKRRLLNLRRDKYKRNPACAACHNGTPCGKNGTEVCKKYSIWLKKNKAKSSLMEPNDITYISDENEPTTREESTVGEEIETKEILAKIDEHLPVSLREPYLKMRDGVSVPKALRLEVEDKVKEILGW